MKVLVIGSGGREHALAWKLSQSPKVSKIFCAPGNAGIAQIAENIDLAADDVTGLAMFAKDQAIDLTVVGPEVSLVAGIVDRFEGAGMRIFGPKKEAAMLEGCKEVAKKLMRNYQIPTASYEGFSELEPAINYIKNQPHPLVVKATGLAAGKGVAVCDNAEEAIVAVTKMIREEAFGSAGRRVIIEERMSGPEVSILLFCDGQNIAMMPASQDHKAAYDGGKGPNTGGMGAFCPSPLMNKQLEKDIIDNIVIPSVHGAKCEFGGFKGIMYIGLMLTPQGPKVLEYNVRFGDPECQPLLMMLETDLVDVINAVIDGNLDKLDIKWKEDSASICLVLAAGGYPGKYEKGLEIEGLDDVSQETVVFHAGTKKSRAGQIVTNGGRVLGVCATGKDLKEAASKCYQQAEKITFHGMQYRTDIGSFNTK